MLNLLLQLSGENKSQPTPIVESVFQNKVATNYRAPIGRKPEPSAIPYEVPKTESSAKQRQLEYL